MAIKEKLSLIEQAKNYLIDEIGKGNYKPGQRIESVRKLTERLGISHVTTANALRELADEGWLVIKTGVGAFVANDIAASQIINDDTQNKSDSNLYFLFGEDLEGELYHSKILCGIQKEIEKYDWQLKVGMANDPDSVKAAEEDESAAGVVVVSTGARIKAKSAVVYYGMSPSFPDSSCVSIDNFHAGYMAGQYLYSKGHREVFYVNAIEKSFLHDGYEAIHFTERWNGLRDYYRSNNILLPEPVSWSVSTGNTRTVMDMLEEVKSGKRGNLTLAVGNRVMAVEIYKQMLDMGLKSPDNVSIITFISRQGKDMVYPFTTMDFSRMEMGRQIALVLKQQLEGCVPPSRVLLPSILQEEGSVADFSKN